MRTFLMTAVLAILVLGGCGSDAERDRLTQDQIARERADAARSARQEERIKQLEKEAAERRRHRKTKVIVVPDDEGQPTAGTDVPVDVSALSGEWTGSGTQFAPRGTTQSVTLATRVAPDGRSGTHSEYITGMRSSTTCRGTLTKRGDLAYDYTEQLSTDCVRHTVIRLTANGEGGLDFSETYSTSIGSGHIEGTLTR